MSFKDLEKKTQKVEDNKDVKPEIDIKKKGSDLPQQKTPAKTAREVAPLARKDDLFDNVPV